MKNYYEILKVKPNDKMGKIKKNLYSLSKKSHPQHSKTIDKTKNFIEYIEAFEVLENESIRRQYDILYYKKIENKNILPNLTERQLKGYEFNVSKVSKLGEIKGKEYSQKNYRKFKNDYKGFRWWQIFGLLLEFLRGIS